MLLTNPVNNDPRVRKEAASLAWAGYEVIVIGVRSGESPYFERIDGYCIHRIKTLKLMFKKTILNRRANRRNCDVQGSASFLIKLRADVFNIISVLWLNMALVRSAVKQQADVYHAHDLDTLLAGFLAKWWTGKKLIYDFHELFTEQYKEGIKTKLWHLFYSGLERLLVKRTDFRLTVCRSLGEWVTERYWSAPQFSYQQVGEFPA